MQKPGDESSRETHRRASEPDDNLTVFQTGCLFLVLSPLIAFVGAIRWNITEKLDADLAAIMTWFCDSAVLFLLLLPLAQSKAKSKIVDRFFDAVTAKLVFTLWVFYFIAIVAFVCATLAAFHYLISLLFVALFGRG